MGCDKPNTMVDTEKKVKSVGFNTFPAMNKPFYLNGLSPIQLILIGSISILLCVMSFIVSYYILVALVLFGVIAYNFFSKVQKENKGGNPDYFDTLNVKRLTKPSYIDQNMFFNLLRK